MNPPPTTAKQVFLDAIEQYAPDQWSSYLDHVCDNDSELRRRVEILLGAHVADGSLLDNPAMAPAATIEHLVSEKPGTQIGPYKVLQQIGEGGFGMVFEAEQDRPVRRRVALKVIKPGMDTREVIARFEAERQALAMMDHPNIAKVHDAGATENGRPYFVMELVQGVPITEYCDQCNLTTRERLELFVTVCQAVQHAHQKGVIHRDIKPTNVLVAIQDGQPAPKIIDFGVAKAINQQLTEHTLMTAFAQIVGTPLYMSPEQAELSALGVDTRSDIYSLGVLLYELLTGSTPFDKDRLHLASHDELRRIIREEEPPRPSARISTLAADLATTVAVHRRTDARRLQQTVRGELDWIVMKALEKDRNRRYETASGFAADIERYLHDEPVEAGPPSAAYRFRKFAKRNRTSLAAGALLTLAILASLGGIISGIMERGARQARVTGQLELILDEVARLEQQEKWHEALIAARRAEPTLAAGEAAPEVQQRARQALADLDLVRRLEETRAESGTAWGTRDGTSIPLAARADQEYSATFRDAGIDVDTLPVMEVVERISARGQVAAAVLPALDDWVAVRSTINNEAATLRLIEVLRIADPDPWRQQMRDLLARSDWAMLESLARSSDLDRQPPATISFLSGALRRQAEADIDQPGGEETELGGRGFILEIDILRRAQHRYPADYWINHRLGLTLIGMKSPENIQRGIGYLRAAVALRPQDASTYNGAAWCLVASPQATRLDSEEAVSFAEMAVELAPQKGAFWNTLGLAQYRAGNWNAAVESLEKSMALREGGDSFDWFVLAMAEWQLGHKADARKWHNNAVEWMDKNQAGSFRESEELRQFRAEAEELLEITGANNATRSFAPQGTARSFLELGQLRVRQGKFREAAINFARVIEHEPVSDLAWLQGGSLLAHLGDREAFRKHCAAMMERFGNTQNSNVAERTAKLMSCVPSDFSGMDPKWIVVLADRAVASGSTHQDLPWFHLAKGMADYRAGHFDSVVLSIEKAKTPNVPVRTVLADLYMAMAQFQLGDREASVKTLDGAVAMMMTLPQPGRDDLGEHFHDYLFCWLARREAEALILNPTKEPTTGNTATTAPTK